MIKARIMLCASPLFDLAEASVYQPHLNRVLAKSRLIVLFEHFIKLKKDGQAVAQDRPCVIMKGSGRRPLRVRLSRSRLRLWDPWRNSGAEA